MINEEIKKILEIFITTSSENDGDLLLEKILNNALEVTNCDAGTLYILNDNKLEFKFMITKSLNIKKGGKKDEINLPPVEMFKSNVCAYSVLENKAVNIADVYSSELFDFSGPQNYDKLTNYKTKSMMVIPMKDDKGNTIGVLQLLNAQNAEGEIIAFSKKSEMILMAIASQAAIKLTNMNYTLEIKELMESIVKTFAQVIYLRTPYNVSHTANMDKYAKSFMNWLSQHPDSYINFSEEDTQLFYMSIWLHDIGKLTTPLSVMDKETRLSTKLERVMDRLKIISLSIKLNCLRKGEDYSPQIEEVERVKSFINEVNTKSFLHNDILLEVEKLKEKTYVDENLEIKKWFTDDEIEDLSIVKGTLTPNERKIIQGHVSMTEQILEKMKFKHEYTKVPIWASNHHEFLDGSGYPKKLSGDEIDIPTRLLTIIDVFDGLSAKDRPYKKPTPINKVIEIMDEMVEEGKLDGKLFSLFKSSKVWDD